MAAERHLALAEERLGHAGAASMGDTANGSMLLVDGGFGEHKAEDDNEHGRAGPEPK